MKGWLVVMFGSAGRHEANLQCAAPGLNRSKELLHHITSHAHMHFLLGTSSIRSGADTGIHIQYTTWCHGCCKACAS